MCMNLKANGLSKTPAFRSGFEGCGIHSRKAMAPLKLSVHGDIPIVLLQVSIAERLWPH